jgi:hypothetical protein
MKGEKKNANHNDAKHILKKEGKRGIEGKERL